MEINPTLVNVLGSSPGINPAPAVAVSPPRALLSEHRLPQGSGDQQIVVEATPHYVVSYKVDYEDLDFYEPLGSGRYGSVYRALLRSRNAIVAVKKVESLGQEVHILSQLSHRNIVRFHGVYSHIHKSPARSHHLQYGIITEYCENGSLYDLLKKIRPQVSMNSNGELFDTDADCDGDDSGGLNFANIVQWATDIARGMNYLHSEAPVQIIHRDLKSTNVVLSRDWMCKICDFGSSRARNRDSSIISVAGTPAWMSPEIIRGEANFNCRVDVWSFGVVLWELLTCEQPFKGLDHYQIMFVVGSRAEHPPIPASCPPSFAELLRHCWIKEPNGRPSFSEIVADLTNMLTDGKLPKEVANFTSATARRQWLLEVEQELTRVKLLEQSLEEREHDIAERERKLLEQKEMIDLQLSRIPHSAGQNSLPQAVAPLHRLDVLNWTEIDVARWVRQLDNLVAHFRGLGRYANLFEANHISGRRLLLLTKNDFQAMGITSVGHQKQFLDEINFLRIASQMVVDFPPLQMSSSMQRQTSDQSLTPVGDAVFPQDEGGTDEVLTQKSASDGNSEDGSPMSYPLPVLRIGSSEAFHPPVDAEASSSSFVLIENRDFYVTIAVGMYKFPTTTINSTGSVVPSTEYRIFIDANASIDLKNNKTGSPDDAVVLTDPNVRATDIAYMFSSVFVIADAGLPTERKICACTGGNGDELSTSICNIPPSSPPYIAKEISDQDFTFLDIEITLRQPFCCNTSKKIREKQRIFTKSEKSYASSASLTVSRATNGENCSLTAGDDCKASFEFVGNIRKRLQAKFGGPIVYWDECITQLSMKSSTNGRAATFQISPSCEDSNSGGSSPYISVTSVRSTLKSTGRGPLPHSPRQLSVQNSVTSPVGGTDDPVSIFCDARRSSVSVTSPNEPRSDSPVAAIIGHAANEHGKQKVVYNSGSSGGEISYASMAAKPPTKPTHPSAGNVHGTMHGHHPHVHSNRGGSNDSPMMREVFKPRYPRRGGSRHNQTPSSRGGYTNARGSYANK